MTKDTGKGRGKLHANLHLLDRQIVENGTGHLLGNVDDLELDLTTDPPRVTAILTGPQVWAERLPGPLKRWLTSATRYPVALVIEIDSAVTIAQGAGDAAE